MPAGTSTSQRRDIRWSRAGTVRARTAPTPMRGAPATGFPAATAIGPAVTQKANTAHTGTPESICTKGVRRQNLVSAPYAPPCTSQSATHAVHSGTTPTSDMRMERVPPDHTAQTTTSGDTVRTAVSESAEGTSSARKTPPHAAQPMTARTAATDAERPSPAAIHGAAAPGTSHAARTAHGTNAGTLFALLFTAPSLPPRQVHRTIGGEVDAHPLRRSAGGGDNP